MSAYATARHGRQLSGQPRPRFAESLLGSEPSNAAATLDAVLADLAERVAAAVVRQLQSTRKTC